jgi:1-acyl-sn-glycerol-3-phosphate acyltransferase
MSLFPRRMIPKLRPVAAADYFLKSPFLAFIALDLIGIIPLERQQPSREAVGDIFAEPVAALDRGEILILFPEGTRGEPEAMADFKSGVGRLVQQRPHVPLVPIFLHGLGKALPKGSCLPVPFFFDVFVGPPIRWPGNKAALMNELRSQMAELATEGRFPEWD